MDKKFDFKDITLVPETISSISSRKEVNPFYENGKLPIFVSPMDTVVDGDNCELFHENKLEVCLPRGVFSGEDDSFSSISLTDFEKIINWFSDGSLETKETRFLVDIANGHMEKLHELCKKFIETRESEKYEIMVGNVANPKTFEKFCEIGVDYVRVGIGGGSGCLTSANTGVHYPMASLISECYMIKKNNGFKTKIIADGGFRNYDDIIKAIALGADYVMLGGILNKTLESCSPTKLFDLIPISEKTTKLIWENFPILKKRLYKDFRGMSTKQVQVKWGKDKPTTSEGISKTNRVEYTLNGWVSNLEDYLRSAMSYTNSKDLEQFKGSDYIFITENALNRYNK
jgi:IMP dehydrogenase/GMP reductase